jgi:hypothetical protein
MTKELISCEPFRLKRLARWLIFDIFCAVRPSNEAIEGNFVAIEFEEGIKLRNTKTA